MARKAEPFRSLGFAAIDWIEHFLVHGPGDVQGQPIELDDEFAAFIVKAGQVDLTGARKVRRAFLSRAKGRAKSELAAMIECYEALGPCRFDHWAEAGEVSYWGYEYDEGEPVGEPLAYVEILNVATEEGQAGNTYDNVYFMLSPETCSPELLAEFGRIDVGLTRTNLPDKRGYLEPVTSADTSKDGGKSTFIVADETHLWILARLRRLHATMSRNLLKRKVASGWMLETSTMYGEGEDSVAKGTHAYAQSRAGDGKLLFDHKQAADHWDLEDREQRIKALHEAYGPAAEWMDIEALADAWDDPQVTEADYRRFWLNQPVPLEETPQSVLPNWANCAVPAADVPASEPAAFGVDMSHDRLVTIGVCVKGEETDHVEIAAYDRADTEQSVVEWLVQRAGRTIPVVIDSYSPAASLVPELETARVKVKVVSSGGDMAKACGAFYDAVNVGRLTHFAGQELLDLAVAGARKRNVGTAGGWAWDRKDGSINLAPLVAVTLAKYGADNFGRRQHSGSAYQRR